MFMLSAENMSVKTHIRVGKNNIFDLNSRVCLLFPPTRSRGADFLARLSRYAAGATK